MTADIKKDDPREGAQPPRDAAELSHAQRMEALGRLTSAVAHDFANLLHAIRGYAILAVDRVPDDVRRDLEELVKVVDIGAALIAQLRTFGERQAVAEIIDAHDAIADLLDMLCRLLGPDVALDRSFDAPVARVRLRRGQLAQILINMAVNARHAMPAGGRFLVRTSVDPWGARRADGTFGDLMIEVRDTGVGIPPEIQDRIFEPYFTTKPHGHGSGLGLSTVYGIVQDAGGSISVTSEVGAGTSFWIRLPLA